MSINPRADRPVHRQLADLLRGRIERGQLRPGDRLPAEHRLAAEYGVSRDSVRDALRILRRAGLVETRAPYGTTVRQRRVVEVTAGPGCVVDVVEPTEAERAEWGIGDDMLAVRIIGPDGLAELHAWDAVRVVYPS